MPTSVIASVQPRRGRGPAWIKFQDGTEASTFDAALALTASEHVGAEAEYTTETKTGKNGKEYVNLTVLALVGNGQPVTPEVVTPAAPPPVPSMLPAVVQSTALVARHELTAQDVIGQIRKIQEIMQAAMKPGEHYGKIPGTPKPTLLKPGAEKLLLTFRLRPDYEVLPDSRMEERFLSYSIRCRLFHIPTGLEIATGLGSCNSRERKFARTVQTTGASVWDLDNTLRKMACKRALVAAVLNGTAASDIFTQDLEDLEMAQEERREPEPPGPALPFSEALESFTVDACLGLEQVDTAHGARTLFARITASPTWAQLSDPQRARVIAAKEAAKGRLGM